MELLSLYLFGGFRAEQNKEPLKAFVSDKARLLLAYLAVEADRSHRRESLAGLFWPEKPEAQAHHSLSQALFTLRKSFQFQADSSILELTPQEVRFRGEIAWLDVNEFNALISTCERHAHDTTPVCPACLERLEHAAALYRGDFLAGIPLRDCLDLEEWLTLKQEHFRQKMVMATGWCSSGFEDQGNLEKALHYATWQSTLERLDESAHRQVMRLLMRMERRAEALAHYSACEKILKEELGIMPEAETVALYHQIHGMVEEDGSLSKIPNNLPATLRRMVGRQNELRRLQQKLLDPNCHLVTVLGAGGAGKTCLALEAGKAVLPFFADGVFLGELDTQQSNQTLLPVIARAIELDLRSEPGRHMGERLGIMEQVCSFMHRKRILLILDGFESMLNEAAQVGELLRRLPDLKVMVTSRARLNLAVEQVFLVEGLAYPAESSEDELGTYSAVQLFVEAARNADPSFELNEHNRKAAAEICRLNQGIPLGILLAAAWIDTLPLQQIVQEIQRNLDFLRADWHDLPDRQRSLRATFDHSWRLLDSAEKAAFLKLSVLRGSFTSKVAEQVAGASLEILKNLVEQSLLQRYGSGSLRMHDLLRQYAQEKLRSMPAENHEIHLRYSLIYMDRLAVCERRLKSAEQPAALAEIDQEYADFLAAWKWAVTNGQMELIEKAVNALWYYHTLRGFYAESWTLCQWSLSCLEPEGLLRTNFRLWLLLEIWLVFGFLQQDKVEQARLLIDRVEAQVNQWEGPSAGMRRELALLRLYRGDVILIGGGNRKLAIEKYREGLEMLSALEDPWDISLALWKNAIGQDQIGNRYESGRYSEQALNIQRSLGDPHILEGLLANSGYFYMLTGDYEGGIKVVKELVANQKHLHTTFSQAFARDNLGLALFYAGQYEQARKQYQEAILFYTQPGEVVYRLFDKYILTCIDLNTGNYAAVKDDSAFFGEMIGDYYRSALSLLKGEVYLLSAEWENAEKELRCYLDQSLSLPRLDMAGQPLALLGYIAYRKGDLPAALHYQEQALQNGLEYGFFWVFMLALAVLALMIAEKGKLEEAIALYATVTAHPCAGNSKWFEDLFGRRVKELCAGLPVEIATAAREKGCRRKLREAGEEYLKRLDEWKT